MALVAAFAISLWVGVISKPYALSALVVGVIWFFSMIAYWRYRTRLAGFISAGVLFFGSDIARYYDGWSMGAHLPFILQLQWMALLVAVAFVLLALFRKPIAHYCRLDENL